MSKILFLGNGLNRCSEGFSWENLLNEFITYIKKEDVIKKINKPFPMLFEEILLRAKEYRDINESDFLDELKIQIQKLKTNHLHDILSISSIKDIITTNYDYLIESGLSSDFKTEYNPKDETKYRIYTNSECGGKKIWHIHGEINKPNTIVLGQKMYSDVLGRYTKYLEKDREEDDRESWIEKIFEEEIHIIGCKLDYSEITIWYILNYRARMISSGKMNRNRMIYYMNQLDYSERNIASSFKSFLEAHYIEVVESVEGETYEHFYYNSLSKLAMKN